MEKWGRFCQGLPSTNFSLLTFFFLWHRYIAIMTFPKDVIFYFYTAIPLDIELKMNVYNTYVCSIYVLFPGECQEASLCYWVNLLNNNLLKVNKKYTKARCEIRQKRKILLFPEMQVTRKIFTRAAANSSFLINLRTTPKVICWKHGILPFIFWGEKTSIRENKFASGKPP